ncbi:MAG: DUF374 domain-containing protein [Chlorobiaceae bacterium]|jgi:lysophospholipid acyltransferase (LPLAT)-like uncharacterized protein|nr:DUF374 domain-containing protein [Chlorobiaceae bacterium]
MVKHILRERGIRLLPHLLKLHFATMKIEFILPDEGVPGKERGVVFAFWHGKMVTGWLLARRLFPDRPISAIVSLSGDGQILSETLDQLGFRLIRGSSSKGKEEVRTGITDALRNCGVVAVTPDGPRGPQHRFKYGTLRIASELRTPLLFAEITHSHPRVLKSWDRFEIPLPFSRITVRLHTIALPEFPGEEALHACADELSTRFADETQ